MKKSIFILFSIAILNLSTLVLAHHKDPKTIAKRTAPVGKVFRTGDTIENVAVIAVVEEATGPRSPETIYKTCAGCHDTGAANAPIVGNKELWAPHISKGLETLLANALQGTAGGMPPKGLCMDCTDDEIKATIEFMIEKSQ